MAARTRLAQLIAREEGFGIAGTIPTLRNNPGDLRHSPHSEHPGGDPNAIGTIDNMEDGWADLERQLALYAERGMTLRQAIQIYAPPSENDSEAYLNFICETIGLEPDVPISVALQIPAAA